MALAALAAPGTVINAACALSLRVACASAPPACNPRSSNRWYIDLSADFAAQLAELKSAEQINDFLGKLLVLVVQNRISARRAAVLAYITNQLPHTVSIMNKENEDNPQIVFDMPGPAREREPSPEPTYDLRT